MPIVNPSFETEGTPIGVPDGWTIEDVSAYVEVAEFGPLLGYERFERDWVLPLGMNLKEGDLDAQNLWAQRTGNTTIIEDPPSADVVLHPRLIVISGVVPGVSQDVTLTYTNQDGVTGRTGTLSLPNGTTEGVEYSFDLEGDDIGFQEITALLTDPAMPDTTVGVVGSWFLAPRNEGAKFEFDVTPGVDIFPINISGNPFEGFEGGWENDGGFRNDLDALITDVGDFGTNNYESFEDNWDNIPVYWAHHRFIDGGKASSYNIVEEVNNVISILYEDFGTLSALTIELDSGEYTPAQMATEIQNKVRTALDNDGGGAVGNQFSVTSLPDNTIRISTSYQGPDDPSQRGYLVLVEPAFASAWELLGFITGFKSKRTNEIETLEESDLNQEAFETGWKNNQDYVTSLADNANGIIAAADFGGAAPNTPEQFEANWTLTLP